MTISHAVTCLIVIACRTHVAETPGDPRPGPSDEPGWLERLESAGISPGASYTAEYSAVVSGGLSRGGSFRSLFSADAERRLSVFFQYGWVDDAASEVGQHVGGGLVMDGPIASRPADSAGLYASLADLSGAAGAGFERDELAIDLYCRAQVDDARIVGFRAGIEF